MKSYSPEFYAQHHDNAASSAAVILPLVLKDHRIRSIIDFGCGLGAWLHEAAKLGVKDYLGLDGNWVILNELAIPPGHFQRADLKQSVIFDRKFDLAMCLEVAEHLPATSADTLIESLTRASGLILFSAAIPMQGGTDHINEQWQDYWVKKFMDRGFTPSDPIRPKVWGNKRVDWWYQQNLLLFSKTSRATQKLTYNLVHPVALQQAADLRRLSSIELLKIVAHRLLKRLKRDRH